MTYVSLRVRTRFSEIRATLTMSLILDKVVVAEESPNCPEHSVCVFVYVWICVCVCVCAFVYTPALLKQLCDYKSHFDFVWERDVETMYGFLVLDRERERK